MFHLLRLAHTSNCANSSPLSLSSHCMHLHFPLSWQEPSSQLKLNCWIISQCLLYSLIMFLITVTSSFHLLLLFYLIIRAHIYAFFFHSGFSVTSAERTRIFKPVSIQTMWWVHDETLIYFTGPVLLTSALCSDSVFYSSSYFKVSAAGVAWLLRAGGQDSSHPRQWSGVGPALSQSTWVWPLLYQWVGGHEWFGVGPQR